MWWRFPKKAVRINISKSSLSLSTERRRFCPPYQAETAAYEWLFLNPCGISSPSTKLKGYDNHYPCCLFLLTSADSKSARSATAAVCCRLWFCFPEFTWKRKTLSCISENRHVTLATRVKEWLIMGETYALCPGLFFFLVDIWLFFPPPPVALQTRRSLSYWDNSAPYWAAQKYLFALYPWVVFTVVWCTRE